MAWKRRFVNSYLALLVNLPFLRLTSVAADGLTDVFSACPVSCRTCDQLGSCLTCEDDKVLQNYECVEKCEDGLFEKDRECHFCPVNCDSCNSENDCTKCVEGSFAEHGVCVPSCSEGFFLERETCLECGDYCVECWTRDECTLCESGMLLQGASCVPSCSNGFSQVDGVCLPCQTGCEECHFSTQKCKKCSPGLFLLNGECTRECPPETGPPRNGACGAVRLKLPRKKLLRLSSIIQVPEKSREYTVKFSNSGAGRLFLQNPMDASWPMPVNDAYAPVSQLEFTADDLDNAWYKPDELTETDYLDFEIYLNDQLVEDSSVTLELLNDAMGVIQPDRNAKLSRVIPPGLTRQLTGMKFSSSEQTPDEEIIYSLNSRLPPGFATIERIPYGPVSEFTQYDLDRGDVIVATSDAWPGHDLTFDFYVSDNEGVTMEPFVYTIHAPSFDVRAGESVELTIDDIGVHPKALKDEDSFYILSQAPFYGDVLVDNEIVNEGDSFALSSKVEYSAPSSVKASEDSLQLTVYFGRKNEDIRIGILIDDSNLGPELLGSLKLDVTSVRQQISSASLSFSGDFIEYKINEDPLWGLIEKRVGNGYSALALGNTFSQSDVDSGLMYYHWYGGADNNPSDYVELSVTDHVGRQVQQKLMIYVSKDPDYDELSTIMPDLEFFDDDSENQFQLDNFDDSFESAHDVSTFATPTVYSIGINEKRILTPADLGISAPSRSDWVEMLVAPKLGEVKNADDGSQFVVANVADLIDGKIVFQSGSKSGEDEVQFTVYLTYNEGAAQTITVPIKVFDADFHDSYVDSSSRQYISSSQDVGSSYSGASYFNEESIDSQSELISPNLATPEFLELDHNRLESPQSPAIQKEGFVGIPSVKNTIEVQANKIKIITELATLPDTKSSTRFTINSPPSKGFLKLLDEAGSEIGSVLSFGDSFLRRDVEEGRLCYEGTGGVGVNTFSIREDSFSYSLGEGQFKRFGEVTIRVEDFTLSSTQDRSLPGSEVENTNENTEFEPDSSEERGASQSVVLGSPIVASFNRRPTPTLTLNTIHCEENARRILSSNDVIADDKGYSQSLDLRLTVSRECRQGRLERLHGSDWRPTDRFTYQDVEDGIVGYLHLGGSSSQDSCVLQLRNAFASSEHVTLNIIVDFLNTGTPRLTANSGLLYLEYIDGVPAGVISANALKTNDPDTQPEELIYSVTENSQFGELVNTELNTRVTSFSQYDVDMGFIRYELTNANTEKHSDQFKFTVTDNKTTLKDNTFVIRFSRLQFEEELITVAETEGEIKVWVSRAGYLNHYAIVACKSISEIALEQQVQFEPGENRKSCVVPLQQDERHQGQKQLDLQLAEPSYALLGRRDSMSIVITDPEDKATISFLTDEIHVNEEQRQVVIPVRREGDASKTATVICFTQAATAGDADFERREPRENDQLVFQGTPYNQRDASCTINLIDDSLFEREEFFYVKLNRANVEARIGAIDTVKVVIDGPNDLPRISMAEKKVRVLESEKLVTVEIFRSGSDLSQESEVFCNSRAGSASPGDDFEQVHEHVIFKANQEVASCEVTIFDDAENPVVEGEENFFVYLSGAKEAVLDDAAETEIVIEDEDEDSPRFEFAAPEYAAAETEPVVSVPVVRHGDTSGPASVICRTLQGSAQIDSDFRERINSDVNRIFFEPGETEKNCDVILLDDEEHEPSETLFLQLKDPQSVNGSPARLGALDETKITLTNAEDTPTITFAKSEVSIREPKPGATKDVTVTVQRFGDTTGNSRVRVSTRDGSAISGVDYEPKSEMLRFRPEQAALTFTVVVKCNEESAWHKTFSLVMGPDEPVNAVLGEFPAMTVTILDKEASGSLVLPAPPAVISLKDFDTAANALDEQLLPGYPAICLTPCDPQHPNFDETQSLCEEAGIDNELIEYSWEVATPDKSNFRRINDATPWTNPKSKVLDSIYFSRKFKIRCRVQAFSQEGKGGTPLRSQPAQVSSEGICHNPLVAGESGFQAQNFQANLKYLDSSHSDHPNSIHITVEVPHEDGLLPLVSTTQINNIDFLLRDRLFRQQHVCSNMLTPEEAPETDGRRGFLDSYDAARVPSMSGFDRPHQFDSDLRSEKTLSLYQYLNLKTCTWTFDSYYTMDELKDICGGRVDKDFELATQDQSHVTVRVPFHVSYIYVQAPTGWAALEHRSEFSVSFYYSNVMWKSGIKTDSELNADVSLSRVSIDANGRLVVELRTRTRFRGLFLESLDKQGNLKNEESSFIAPMGVRTNFTLELVWSQDTFDSAEQHWKAISKYSRKDYTGEYTLSLIPCTVQPTQGFEPGSSPLSICSPQEKAEFAIKIGIQQSARPVPVVYSLNTHFHITNSEQVFLSAPGEYPLEEMDYRGTFSKGSKVYARIMWESQQDLKDAYNLQIEKVYICTGSDGYIPTFDPSGEMYGEGPQFGCIKPMKEISSRFLVLDRDNRDAEDLTFQAIPFEAQFADENEDYKALATMTSTDGFAFSVDPLYKIIAGHEWYIQVLYEIEGSQGRSRRSVIQPGHQLARRAAISSSRNGTNIGILQIDEVQSASTGVLAGSIGGVILFVVAILGAIFARRESSKEDSYESNSLTPEEVGLLQQKIDYSKLVNQNRVQNNKLKNYQQNNYNLRIDPDNRSVNLKSKPLSSRDHHVTIHNNLGKSGTEI